MAKPKYWQGMEKYVAAELETTERQFLRACKTGDINVVNSLLAQKVDPNMKNHVGFTALMFAAQDIRPDVCEALLKAGADPNVSMGKGRDMVTAMDCVAGMHPVDCNRYKTVPPLLGLFRKYGGKSYAELQSGKQMDYVLKGPFCYPIGDPADIPKEYAHLLNTTGAGYGYRDLSFDATAKGKKETTAKVAPAAKTVPKVEPLFKGPKGTFALIFPGQGSQHVGMLKDVKDFPAVKKMLSTAIDILGKDILPICLNGPSEDLDDSLISQPALLIAGLAALEKLKMEKKDLGAPKAVAGMSAGEYAALVCAGVFSFEDALKLIKARSEAMNSVGSPDKYMASIAGLPKEKVEELCEESRKNPGVFGFGADDETCLISTSLFSKGFTVSGTPGAIQRIEQKAKEAGCKQVQLITTTGPWHTKDMKPALKVFEPVLTDVLTRMKPPTCDLYMNVNGQKIPAGTAPLTIAKALGEQMMSCVLWDTCMKSMIQDNVSNIYELGPQGVLRKIIKLIDNAAFEKTESIVV